MINNKIVFGIILAALLNASPSILYGQIIGGKPCSDDQVDAIAICFSHVVCAKPPSPIDSFDIGARAFATCPNQPVDNFAQVDVTIGGPQALATAQARALIFNRVIHKEILLCYRYLMILKDVIRHLRHRHRLSALLRHQISNSQIIILLILATANR